jgi:hypothetical protein
MRGDTRVGYGEPTRAPVRWPRPENLIHSRALVVSSLSCTIALQMVRI